MAGFGCPPRAWGREEEDREGGPSPGLRLFCSRAALREVLKRHDKELLVLIRLQRREKESLRANTQYFHTVAVVRVKQTLDCEFYRGVANRLHVSRY